MPRWDFECEDCGWINEEIHFPTYADSIKNIGSCFKCGSQKLKRLPSKGAFVVNGYNATNRYS